MAQVLCKLPNASELINGVKFSPQGKVGMISEDITDEQAAHFLQIKGYVIVKAAPAAAPAPAPAPSTPPVPPKPSAADVGATDAAAAAAAAASKTA